MGLVRVNMGGGGGSGKRGYVLLLLIAVAEKALAAMLRIGAERATVVWRRAERADGLATRMQRAIEAIAAGCMAVVAGMRKETGRKRMKSRRKTHTGPAHPQKSDDGMVCRVRLDVGPSVVLGKR